MDAAQTYIDIPDEIQKEFIGLVSPKGTITIPLEVRKRFKIEPNSKVLLRLRQEALEVKPMPMTFEETFGSVTPINRPEDFQELRHKALKEKARDVISKMQQ